MARSPAEIQADIALTRRVIERQLDALTPRAARAWDHPWTMAAAGLTVGVVLSRASLRRLVGTVARLLQAGIAIAGTAAAIERLVAERVHPRAS